MFGQENAKDFSASDMIQGLKTDTWETLTVFKSVLLHGVLAWCIFIPFATTGLYLILLPLMRAGIKKMRKGPATSPIKQK